MEEGINIIFLVVSFLFLLFLVVFTYNHKYRGNGKKFLLKLLKYFLYVLCMLFICLIVFVLFGICYKIFNNWFIASILTVAISFIIYKIIETKYF